MTFVDEHPNAICGAGTDRTDCDCCERICANCGSDKLDHKDGVCPEPQP